jgi:Ca2+-binding RTX toxin-like protein
VVDGSPGDDDPLNGTPDADTVSGLGGSDTIDGLAGNDTLDGGEGSDLLRGGAGNDVITGGAGRDFLLYDDEDEQGGTRGIVLDAAAGTAIDTFGDTDTFSGFEVYVGSRFGDRMTGTDAGDEIYGDAGKDTLRGGAGDDLLGGGGGIDTLDGGSGSDFASYEFDVALGGTRGLVANLATGRVTDSFGKRDTLISIENLIGSALADNITGSRRDNTLFGAGGSDRIAAGRGDDTLIGGAGSDRLDGDAGVDVASYASDHLLGAMTGIVADLGAGTVRDGYGRTDRLIEVEVVIGSAFDDVLTGSSRPDGLDGSAGDDLVRGLGGDDFLFGAAGEDRVEGGSGSDEMYGDDGNDVLIGGSGNDRIFGGAGDDVLIAGSGTSSASQGLTGGEGSDTFVFTGSEWYTAIFDFGVDGADRIDLSGVAQITSFEDLVANHLIQVPFVTLIRSGDGLIIEVSNTSTRVWTADDFIF